LARAEKIAQMPLSTSVIIVARNSELYIRDALQSLRSQTLPPDETIVVDGRSVDRTREIALTFPGLKLIEQPNLGLANARNVGIAHAQGDLIAFLDSDDLWHPTKLEKQIYYLTHHPDVQYCLTHLQFVGAGPKQGHFVAAATPSVLVAQRCLFEQIGDFDPQYQIGCDADWFMRARDFDIATYTVPETLVDKRIHGANLSHDAARNRRELAHIAARSIARNRLLHGAYSAHS
jgi:glycosyltransferase involved in cell wall biosynthesis